jgi:metal-responsive CopG/Arc/MetJ family transcriptional regulator
VDDILEAVPTQEAGIVEKTKPIPVRLPESLIKDLDEIAKETNRKRADVVRRFLIFSVKQYKARRKSPKRK